MPKLFTPEEREARNLAVGQRLKEARAQKRRTREAATSSGPEGGGRVRPHGGPPPAASAANLKPGGVPSAETFGVIGEIVGAYHRAGLGKGKPLEQMLGLALRGWEIGIPPGEAIAGLYVSAEGGEAMTGELMRSQIHRSGVGRIEVIDSTESRCQLRGVRRGFETMVVTYDLADAKRAGLLGGEMWTKYPRQLLFNRCTSELGRIMFSDVLMGVSYTPEEIGAATAPVGEAAGQSIPPARSAPRGPAASPPPAQVAEKGAGKPQEARKEAETAQEAPPPARVSPAASVEVEPPANGGKHPERALSVRIDLPVSGGMTREVYTAGVTAEQIAMLQAMTGKGGGYVDWQGNQAKARAYFQKWNLPVDLRYLTKDEADGLVAELSASSPLAADGPAGKALDVVIARYGLEEHRAEIVEIALTKFQVLTLGEMTVEQAKVLGSQLEAIAGDPVTFPLLLSRLRLENEGIA